MQESTHPKKSALTLAERASSPGILRIYLASSVAWQHVQGGGFGTVSVYLFYILSGYWISSLWKSKYRHCKHPYLVFLTSRFWRLMPVYWVSAAIAILAIRHFSQWWVSWRAIQFHSPLWLLDSVSLVGNVPQPPLIPPFWSLHIEMQFYFIAPLVIAAATVARRSLWLRVILVVAFSAGFFGTPLMINALPYLLFFVAGCELEAKRWKPPRALVTCSSVLLLVSYGAILFLGWDFWDESFQGIAKRLLPLACVVMATPFVALSLQRKSGHLDRVLGDLAYPIYLLHFTPFLIIDHIGMLHRLPAVPRMALYLMATWAISIIIYFIVDRPSERGRRKFIARMLKAGYQEDAISQIPQAHPPHGSPKKLV